MGFLARHLTLLLLQQCYLQSTAMLMFLSFSLPAGQLRARPFPLVDKNVSLSLKIIVKLGFYNITLDISGSPLLFSTFFTMREWGLHQQFLGHAGIPEDRLIFTWTEPSIGQIQLQQQRHFVDTVLKDSSGSSCLFIPSNNHIVRIWLIQKPVWGIALPMSPHTVAFSGLSKIFTFHAHALIYRFIATKTFRVWLVNDA